jgi:diguanylate cyclase (GGDEF)-like protein/PAS domain S-box-containing protein
MRRRDGVLLDVLLRSAALDPDDLDAGLVFTVLDVTDRKRAERQREDTRRLLDLALEGGEIGTYSALIPDGTVNVDARYLAMLGYRPGELTLDWQAWLAMIHPDDRPVVEARAATVLQGEADSFEAEYRMRHRLGHWVWVLDRARVHERSADTSVLQTAGTHLDITRRREAEGQVIYLVEHDAATNVLNRRGIMRSIKTILGQAERSGRPFALAILDLDLFKEINDAYGHLAGDAVLLRVAEILTHELRSADWVGRWGGDEFILVIPDSTAATAMATVERVRERIGAALIDADGHQISITVTVGLALFRPETDGLQGVIQRADAALYLAKRRGRNCAVFDGAEEGQAAISIAAMLQESLRQGWVEIDTRPVSVLRSHTPCADELVGRVLHPSHGVLDQAACVDVAQQLGLMHRIDHVVIEAAVQRLLAANPEDSPDGGGLVFVRLSRDSLTHASHVRALSELLASLPAPAAISRLVLTVDEAQCAQGAAYVLAALRPVLDLGCKLGIDGVGGPQSTTRFLVDLPASFLFLDADLIQLAASSDRAKTALYGIIQTARDLGCTTIGRCDDDRAVLQRLAALGIDWAESCGE